MKQSQLDQSLGVSQLTPLGPGPLGLGVNQLETVQESSIQASYTNETQQLMALR